MASELLQYLKQTKDKRRDLHTQGREILRELDSQRKPQRLQSHSRRALPTIAEMYLENTPIPSKRFVKLCNLPKRASSKRTPKNSLELCSTAQSPYMLSQFSTARLQKSIRPSALISHNALRRSSTKTSIHRKLNT